MTLLFMYDAPLLPEAGGTERATKLVMDELERRGHNCIGLLHFNQENPDEYFLNNIKINSLSEFLSKNKVDVVVNQIAFHNWLLKAFLEHGGEKWRNEGGKIISVLHFSPYLKPLHLFYRRHFAGFKKKNLYGKIKRVGLLVYKPIIYFKTCKEKKRSYKWIYENSDAYILLSDSFYNEFIQLSGILEITKLFTIPNMYTFPEIISDLDLIQKNNEVLVVSRMEENQKRISLILKIWSKIKNHRGFRLTLVGDGVDLPFYKKYVINNKIKDVVFKGQQNPLPFYKRASIFLMTSRHEGWGLTITESMQNGVVPIVLNTTSVFKDLIKDGTDGYLPDNIKLFRQSLETLMTDNNTRIRLAKNAINNVQKYSPTNIGDLWEKLLFKLK